MLRRGKAGAPAPVQAFVDNGVDFVTATNLPDLVAKMNALPDVSPWTTRPSLSR